MVNLRIKKIFFSTEESLTNKDDNTAPKKLQFGLISLLGSLNKLQNCSNVRPTPNHDSCDYCHIKSKRSRKHCNIQSVSISCGYQRIPVIRSGGSLLDDPNDNDDNHDC